MEDFIANFLEQSEIILRFIFAVLASGIIGFEREYKGESAGLRTHILIGLGACIAIALPITYVNQNPNSSGIDTMRVVGSVMSGVGFLGAGAIMQVGLTTKGLTTAANIWVTAALGLLIGAGFYYLSILVTIIVLINLIVITKLESYFTFRFIKYQMEFTISEKVPEIGEVKNELKKLGLRYENLKYTYDEKNAHISFNGRVKREKSLGNISEKLHKVFNIKKICVHEN